MVQKLSNASEESAPFCSRTLAEVAAGSCHASTFSCLNTVSESASTGR